MYLLREQLRDFTKDRLDAAAQPLFVFMQGWRISPLRVSFASNQQVDLVTLRECIFPLIESIGGVGRDLCSSRQSERQVRFSSRRRHRLYRRTEDTCLSRD